MHLHALLPSHVHVCCAFRPSPLEQAGSMVQTRAATAAHGTFAASIQRIPEEVRKSNLRGGLQAWPETGSLRELRI